jgi:dTMP kinase
MTASLNNNFITVEGNEGVGKTTVMNFLKDLLEKNKCQYVATREPGGPDIAEKIRQLILEHHEEVMAHDTELLLLFAGRAQHIEKLILPTLKRGEWVISDRFTDASFAYQGGARGIPLERIESLADWVQGGLWPSLTLLLDAPVDIAMERVSKRGAKDRIELEKIEFFENVRRSYLDLAKKNPNRFVLVDASQNQEKVCYDIAQIMNQRFGLHVD